MVDGGNKERTDGHSRRRDPDKNENREILGRDVSSVSQ